MIRTIQTASLALLAFVFTSSPNAHAAILVINGIEPFDTNLGMLVQTVVTLDPISQQTASYETNFSSVDSHPHTVNPPPVLVPGFDTFTFVPVQTSVENSPSFGSHSHSFNLLASVKFYTGANLNWFLNPANAPINSVFTPAFQTSFNEGHVHSVNLNPIVPRTAFTYTPVPEPGTLSLLVLGGITQMCRRKRRSHGDLVSL